MRLKVALNGVAEVNQVEVFDWSSPWKRSAVPRGIIEVALRTPHVSLLLLSPHLASGAAVSSSWLCGRSHTLRCRWSRKGSLAAACDEERRPAPGCHNGARALPLRQVAGLLCGVVAVFRMEPNTALTTAE